MDNEFLATSTKAAPIAVESASGAVIRDVDGNTLLDFASGVAVLNIGHCHPKVVKAVQEQAAKLMHFAGTDYYYDIQSELAKTIVQGRPGALQEEDILFQFRYRGDREAAMKLVRWNRPEPKAVHRLHRRLPRPDVGFALPDRVQEGAAGPGTRQ